MYADIQSFFGQSLLILCISVWGLLWLYKKSFPNNEPGEIAKKGFIDWVTKRLK